MSFGNKKFAFDFKKLYYLFIFNFGNHKSKKGRKRCPRAPRHPWARAPPWPLRALAWAPRSPSSTPLRPGLSFWHDIFCYLIPRIPRGPYLAFLISFVFQLCQPGFQALDRDVFLRLEQGRLRCQASPRTSAGHQQWSFCRLVY